MALRAILWDILAGFLLICFAWPIKRRPWYCTACTNNITKGMLQVQDGGKHLPVLWAQPFVQERILPVSHLGTAVVFLGCTLGTTELTRGTKRVQIIQKKKLELRAQ